MRPLKIILVTLLFFISIVFAFNESGPKDLEVFATLPQKGVPVSKMFLRYPPGTFLVYKTIINKFPTATVTILPSQNAWLAWKITSFIFYIVAWIALLYLNKGKNLLSNLDASLAFLASASLTLGGLSLGLTEFLAIPPLILSLLFLSKRKALTATFFYFTSVVFSWYLLILTPFFFVFIWKKHKKLSKSFLVAVYLILPLILGFYLFKTAFELRSLLPSITLPRYIGFSPLVNFKKSISGNTYDFLTSRVDISLTLAFVFLSFISFLTSLLLKKFLNIKTNILLLVVPVFGLTVGALLTERLSLFLLLTFIVLIFSSLKKFAKARVVTFSGFAHTLLSIFCIGSLFLYNQTDGNLLFIPLTALVLFILSPNEANKSLLFAVNLISFLALFIFRGVTGEEPLKGIYFELTRVAITLGVLLFYTKVAAGIDQNFIKKFLIILVIVLNFVFLASSGSPDIISWRQYSHALSKFPNPFYAQTIVDQRYPPLSMAILGPFTALWDKTFHLKPVLSEDAISSDYGYPAKASVLMFYFLMIWLFTKLSRHFARSDTLGFREKIFIFLTVFSLIIQTQGFVDFNIHVIPTLILAIFALFEKKYLLSGLLLGITISIKWQPIILVPIFGATLFTFQEPFKEALIKSLKFSFGLILIPIIVWTMVIRQPGGWDAFNRSFDYLKQGAPMLSGQALNLNWIVTYSIHVLQPEKDVSLEHLGGLNRQVPTLIAPKIFRGYLFWAATFLILCFYWLKQKKTIVNFMAASIMVFLSHQILNKSAYEKHLFYTVALMLFLYLIRPLKTNRLLLVIFDVMAIMNLIFFYGFTGPKIVNRMVLGFDITVLFSFLYVLIYLYIFVSYLKKKLLVELK